MQEVWFAVAREALRYEASARFTTWLFTIARNRIIDWARVQRPQTSLDAPDGGEPAVMQLGTDPGCGPLAAAVASEQANALSQALASLPAEQRDAFLMHIEAALSVGGDRHDRRCELRDGQESIALRAREATRFT